MVIKLAFHIAVRYFIHTNIVLTIGSIEPEATKTKYLFSKVAWGN